MYLLDTQHLLTIQKALNDQACTLWGDTFMEQDEFWDSDLQQTMGCVEDSLHLLGHIPFCGLVLGWKIKP
jgi:hypothetical protein